MCREQGEGFICLEVTVHRGNASVFFPFKYSDSTETTYPAFAHTTTISKCNSKPKVSVPRNLILCSLILLRQQLLSSLGKALISQT